MTSGVGTPVPLTPSPVIGAPTAPPIHLTVDDLTCLLPGPDFAQLPPVLALRPSVDTVERLIRLRAATASSRHARGLTDAHDRPTPGVADLLATLTRPGGTLDVRAVEHAALQHVSDRWCVRLTDRGYAVRARIDRDGLDLAPLGGDVAAIVVRDLGSVSPSRAESTRCPVDDVESVLGPCRRHVEVVGTAHRDGVGTRPAPPFALYDTAEGRVIARTTSAADGSRWATLSPATTPRILASVRTLLQATSAARPSDPELTRRLLGRS